MCIDVLPAYMCSIGVPDAHREEAVRAHGNMVTEVVSHYVCAENRT